MSSCLLAHGYQAIDTDREAPLARDRQGARVFELRRPDGTLVEEYYGIMLESVLKEMDTRLRQDWQTKPSPRA